MTWCCPICNQWVDGLPLEHVAVCPELSEEERAEITAEACGSALKQEPPPARVICHIGHHMVGESHFQWEHI